jgi:hypothetical protein
MKLALVYPATLDKMANGEGKVPTTGYIQYRQTVSQLHLHISDSYRTETHHKDRKTKDLQYNTMNSSSIPVCLELLVIIKAWNSQDFVFQEEAH